MRRVEIKKQYILGTLIFVIALVTVGFALLQSSLSISGTVSTKNNSWNIYFDNIVLNQDSVSKTLPTISNRTALSFNVELGTPGDFYEFSVDAVNDGTLDAMVRTITATNLTEEQAKLIDLSYTYEDGAPIESKDYLKSSTRETIKVSVKYKDDINNEDLPSSNVSLPITIEIEYVQADDTANERKVVQKDINLYNLMKENADKTTVINFSEHSGMSGTNGIYTTTETEGNVPVYYYRGAADQINNNVIFNNMCWKIIRTTETGGVKLIYNGTPNAAGECVATGTATQIGKSAFNTSYNDNAYVGYMYGTPGSSTYAATHANTNNSTIKTYIDTWYTANFDEIATAKLEDTVFCNDRSTKAYDVNTIGNTGNSSYGALGYGTNATFYGAAHRACYFTKTPAPTLVCSNTNDKFTVSSANGNGALTNPVGLITLDEVVLAGYNTYSSNTSNYQDKTNYLHTGQFYWTFSPVSVASNGFAGVGNVDSTGAVDDYLVSNNSWVRPVVSLADGTLVEPDGEGTSTNPYVVK